MNIERDDFFVVERGPMTSRSIIAKQADESVAETDLSPVEIPVLKGLLLKALDIHEPYVACEIVWVPHNAASSGEAVGQRYILTTGHDKMILASVSKSFAAALMTREPAPRHNPYAATVAPPTGPSTLRGGLSA